MIHSMYFADELRAAAARHPEIAAMCYRANGHEGRAILCLGNVIINALELFRHYFA